MATERLMESKNNLRAPVSQKPLKIEIPTDLSTIGGTVSVEINEKKLLYLLAQQYLKLVVRTE